MIIFRKFVFMHPVGKKKYIISFAACFMLMWGTINAQARQTSPLSIEDSISYYLKAASESIKHNDDKITKSFVGINRALALSASIDNDSLEHIVIIKIGQFYNKINDHSQSKYYLNKGIDFFKPRNNYDALSVAYKSLGALFYKLKKYDKTLEYTKLAYSYALKAKDRSVGISVLYNLAFFAENIHKDMNLCKKYSLMGIALVEQLKDSSITSNRLRSYYAYTLLKENRVDESWEAYQPVIKFHENLKAYRDISIIHKNFISYYEKHFNKKKMLYFVKQHRENFQKYDEAITERTIAEIRDAENFNTLALKFKLSKNQLEMAKHENDSLIYLISILSLLFILASISSVIIKRKNSLLKKLKTNAENASLQKSKFIAMISHELRTPLHAVVGFSSFLIKDKPKDSQKKHLELLSSSANHLLNLINNVLKLYEFDYKEIKPINKIFNFRETISMTTGSFAILFEQRNNLFRLNIDEDIEDAIYGDAQKITQILTNLISNANKFTQNGYVTLTIKQLNIEGDMSTLYFSVEDTGKGIAKAHHESIFEAFNPNTMNIEKTHDGSGLGLSIVRKLLQIMDSDITLESELGKGSKFAFILKLKVAKKTSAKELDIDYNKIGKSKILVVEDNKINQLLVKKILNKEKASYDLCENGLIAVNKFKSKPKNYYDLILMDMHMPVMNGYEATKIIRSIDSNIPIIAMTATNLSNDTVSLNAKGLSAVIHKPFTIGDLFDVMSKHILSKAI